MNKPVVISTLEQAEEYFVRGLGLPEVPRSVREQLTPRELGTIDRWTGRLLAW